MNTLEAQLTAVAIPVGRAHLPGQLHVPFDADGLVLFGHSGGSSRHSPSTQRVAECLHDVGLATLLFDLLPETSRTTNGFDARLRNDIGLLAERFGAATRWARQHPELSRLDIGCLGANNAATAALIAATDEQANIQAVVTRGGRPELTDATIRKLRAATMLIVGGNDGGLVAMNLEAWARLRCEKSIEIIPGVGHLFEEPGALDNVAALAARWFSEHLRKDASTTA